MKFELPCPVDNAIQVAPLAGAWIEIDEELLDPAVALSLPSRERGLKYALSSLLCCCVQSLPSRERGLKYAQVEIKRLCGTSLPSRERGLKSFPTTHAVGSRPSLPSRERGLKSAIGMKCIKLGLRRSLRGSMSGKGS